MQFFLAMLGGERQTRKQYVKAHRRKAKLDADAKAKKRS